MGLGVLGVYQIVLRIPYECYLQSGISDGRILGGNVMSFWGFQILSAVRMETLSRGEF